MLVRLSNLLPCLPPYSHLAFASIRTSTRADARWFFLSRTVAMGADGTSVIRRSLGDRGGVDRKLGLIARPAAPHCPRHRQARGCLGHVFHNPQARLDFLRAFPRLFDARVPFFPSSLAFQLERAVVRRDVIVYLYQRGKRAMAMMACFSCCFLFSPDSSFALLGPVTPNRGGIRAAAHPRRPRTDPAVMGSDPGHTHNSCVGLSNERLAGACQGSWGTDNRPCACDRVKHVSG